MNRVFQAIAARNVSPTNCFIELQPMPNQLGLEEMDSAEMVFARICSMTTLPPDPATGSEELIRFSPYDGKAFFPRLVNANELVKYQSY